MKRQEEGEKEEEYWRMTQKISSVVLERLLLAAAISLWQQDHDIVVGYCVGGLLVQDDESEGQRETPG